MRLIMGITTVPQNALWPDKAAPHLVYGIGEEQRGEIASKYVIADVSRECSDRDSAYVKNRNQQLCTNQA